MVAWLRYTKKRLLIVLMAASVLAAVFGRGVTSSLRGAAHVLIAPLGDGGMYLVTSLRSGAGGSPLLSTDEARRIIEENEQLRRQLDEVERGWLVERQERQRELAAVQGIHAAFQPSPDLPCELIPARVVATDSLPYTRGKTLNVGRSAVPGAPVLTRLLATDRTKEMPPRLAVVTASALVGRIESAGPFTAHMQLVSDSGFSVRGRLLRRIDPARPRQIKVLKRGSAADEPLSERNNAPVPVLASGDGAGGLRAQDVNAYENIQPGDWLVTADDDPYLRREIRVGVVEEVSPQGNDRRFVQVRIRPFEDLSALRDVYVVYWKPF
jgi:cell shape-determining protein MreC